MNDLISIQTASTICRIKWEHAFDLMSRGIWTAVRNGPGNHCIRVRKSEVDATAKKWGVDSEATEQAKEAKASKAYKGSYGDSRRVVRRVRPAS